MNTIKLTLTAKYNDQEDYLKVITQLESLGWVEYSGKALLNDKEEIKSFESKFIKKRVRK